MSETKRLAKCVLGFLLAILVMVGGAIGLDVDVAVQENTEPTQAEDLATDELGTEPEEDVLTEEPTVETEQSTVDSTPTEDEETSVDDSVEEDVTEPTDENQDTVTEGEN
jgi:cytoskeletal protein RodZ